MAVRAEMVRVGLRVGTEARALAIALRHEDAYPRLEQYSGCTPTVGGLGVVGVVLSVGVLL